MLISKEGENKNRRNLNRTKQNKEWEMLLTFAKHEAEWLNTWDNSVQKRAAPSSLDGKSLNMPVELGKPCHVGDQVSIRLHWD